VTLRPIDAGMKWRRTAEPQVRGLVRLHMKKDPRSFEGLLLEIVEGHYRLANARLLVNTNSADDIPVDGDTFVPCGDVHYAQKVG
jgi:hypothetical protein